MTISEWLTTTTNTFNELGIETGRLDSVILLEDALGRDRAYLLAQPETALDDATLQSLNDMVIRRSSHEPLAYIRGKSEFYGREFIVNDYVLVPRPETESMIELLKLEADNARNIIDLGTGSGILAITAKLEIPNAKVTAIDIDESCLRIARSNATKLGADVEFLRSDLFEGVSPNVYSQQSTVLLANLPYVPDEFEINKAATHEPSIAIFGGVMGMDFYRRMFEQINHFNTKPVYVFTESLIIQHDVMKVHAQRSGYTLVNTDGLAQAFRL